MKNLNAIENLGSAEVNMKALDFDLVAATSTESVNCFTATQDGSRAADFCRVVITIVNADGSKKKYIIQRQNRLYATSANHSIESYTIPANATWYNSQCNNRYKRYNNADFEMKLKRLARDIRKLNYFVRIG